MAQYIDFNTLERGKWLEQIADIRNNYAKLIEDKYVCLRFNSDFSSADLQPIHFVTLACLIEFLHQNKHKVLFSSGNDKVRNLLVNDLQIQRYWSSGQNHVDSVSDTIFNLWRIVESEKDLYSKTVEEYFKTNYFAGKDLSAISLTMVEAYYNVFDHADAEGNAFSLIKYETDTEVLHIAICDFGKGIAKSVRDFNPTIPTDAAALLKSIEVDFTVGSKVHNKGKGLDNILSCADEVRIFCNNALLLKKNQDIETYMTNFCLVGTLIYFEISLANLEDEEILDEFTF